VSRAVQSPLVLRALKHFPRCGLLLERMAIMSSEISVYSPAVAELVAIGAAIASNCEPCFKYHYAQAQKLGVSSRDMACAVAMAQAVKDAPARAMLGLAERYLGCSASPQDAGAPGEGTCCAPATTGRSSKCC
jgi:AhpD family alkylhydroperoxidase